MIRRTAEQDGSCNTLVTWIQYVGFLAQKHPEIFVSADHDVDVLLLRNTSNGGIWFQGHKTAGCLARMLVGYSK